jgi:peptidoglycan/LPS O-acetylase OafA/YrhL
MRHSANLDILRSFAVSVVIVDHLALTLDSHGGYHRPWLIPFAFHIGQVGVLAFFVHTSLVLMYSLERMTRSLDRVTLRFYTRRLFRIYPLAIFCVTMALIFHVPDATWRTPAIITRGVVLSNLLLMQNLFGKGNILAPLWSLPYEVQMYLVLPVLYHLANRKRAATYLCGLIGFFCLAGILLYWRRGYHLNIVEYVPCFLCGVLCYSLRDRVPSFVPAVFWPPFVLLLMSAYCVSRPPYDTGSFWIGWIFCLLLGLAINAFHDSTNRYLDVVAGKIALYSYGMYLIHIPVLYLVFIVFRVRNLVLSCLLFVGLTIIASAVTYYLIEFPLIEVGRKLSLRLVRARVPILAQEGTIS